MGEQADDDWAAPPSGLRSVALPGGPILLVAADTDPALIDEVRALFARLPVVGWYGLEERRNA